MKTVNLQLSRTLKELGYGQSEAFTSFYWVKIEDLEGYFLRHRKDIGVILDKIASPTADEILGGLPKTLPYETKTETITLYLEIYPITNRDEWGMWYKKNSSIYSYHPYETEADTLANAAAKLWLYLKENNLLPTQSERK